MKLPYCPRCGAKSFVERTLADTVDLSCEGCDHAVYGHFKIEAAVKAFLWEHAVARGNAERLDILACGCPLGGCTHKMFETDLPLVAG